MIRAKIFLLASLIGRKRQNPIGSAPVFAGIKSMWSLSTAALLDWILDMTEGRLLQFLNGCLHATTHI